MSFIFKLGSSDQKEKQLMLVRKRYLHNILQYNQTINQEKRNMNCQEKININKRFQIINSNAFDSLQNQIQEKKRSKIHQQMLLKHQYQRQIQEKQQKKIQEKNMDRQFAKLLAEASQYDSDRRIQDLMKIYNRSALQNIAVVDREKDKNHRRIKTESKLQDHNPQELYESKLSKQLVDVEIPKSSSFLPQIKRNDTVTMKDNGERYKSTTEKRYSFKQEDRQMENLRREFRREEK